MQISILLKKRTILLGFCTFYQNIRELIGQKDILKKWKLSPFPNSLQKTKELFDLIFSKIIADGGISLRIIDISLFIILPVKTVFITQYLADQPC